MGYYSDPMNIRSFVLLLAAVSATATPNLLSRLPVYFEPAGSGYLAQTAGYQLYLDEGSVSVGAGKEMITLRFPGAAPRGLEALDQLQGYSNYLSSKGNRRRVPHFERVKYQQLYPGVDLVLYGSAGQLEYDFLVAPGADASLIRMELSGYRELGIETNGDLLVETGTARLVLHAPVAYQMSQGRRVAVRSRFRMTGSKQFGFELGEYDRSQSLTIDPVISFATYLGGTLPDAATAIALDPSGNVYLAGYTNSTNFPVSSGSLSSSYSGGGRDLFIAKLNSTGNVLLYSTYLGGTGDETPVGMLVDAGGNVTLGGNTTSSDFPQTGGTFQSTGSGMFVARLSADGSRLLASGFLGDIGEGFMTAIARDAGGNILLGGYTDSTGFPVSQGALQSVKRLERDGFLTKITSDLSTLLFATYLGGDSIEQVNAIVADSQSNIYVVGQTMSPTYPSASYASANRGASDPFVTRINSTGTAILSSAVLGGSLDDFGQAIAIGPNGNVFVAGLTYSSNYPTTTGVFQYLRPPTGTAAFLTKMPADLTTINYSTYFGSTGSLYDARGIASVHVDSTDSAYLIGYGFGGGLPVTSGALQSPSSGAQDGFVARFNAAADILNYSTYVGGAGDEVVAGSVIDSANNVYVAGSTSSANFPVTGIALQSTYRGNLDAFAMKIDFGTAVVTCNYSLSAATLSLDASGGVGSFDVTTGSGCPYAATSTVSWIAITEGTTGTGSGTVRFTVAANTTLSNRTGQVRLASATFTITQSAATCSFVVDPQNRTMPASGGLISFLVTAIPGCTWTAASAAPWVRLVSTASGNGNGGVPVSVDENTTGIPRTGSLTIARQVIQLLQPSATPSAAFDDVAVTHPFADYIYLMKSNMISDTCNNANQYCPEANTTRAQMALFIVRKLLSGDTFTYPTRPYFDDVGPDHPQFPHIQKLRELGITTGCTATTFCPNDSLTRGQMSAFIVRARLGIRAGQTFPFNATQLFTDVPSTDIFYSFIQKMKELGVTSGCTATDYCPGGLTTRGQMAVFVVRALLTP